MTRIWDSPAPPADPPSRAALTDHRTAPLGVVPRQLQQWALVGTVVVMVSIMVLSGNRAPSRPAATMSTATTAAVDPNQQRIEEYQRRIQEQTQRLASEQAALQAAKATVAAPPERAAVTSPSKDPDHVSKIDSLQQERAQRDYRSLFADNLALSREHSAAALTAGQAPVGPPAVPPPLVPMAVTPPPPPFPSGPTVLSPAPAPDPVTAVTPVSVAAVPAVPPTAGASAPRVGPPVAPDERRYPIHEGSVIETVLTNRLDGTYAGPVNCLVTTPSYAPDRQHLLIPAGARALGEARAVNAFGQSRLAVVFHRILLPNGTRIDLEAFHGLNQVGETGLRDLVDRHYAQIFGASLAVGAIAGLAQAQTTVGVGATAMDGYLQGTSTTLAQSSARILDRFLNLLPTVTIREGHRIKVYLSNDLTLPEYRDPPPTHGGHS